MHDELSADWSTPYSDYNPQPAFDKFGAEPGSAPSKTSGITPVVSKQMKKKSKPKPSDSNSTSDNNAIQWARTEMGLYKGVTDGVNSGMQKSAVKAYQRAP